MADARGKRRGERQPAESRPIARVYVDVPLAHLDRTFDYQVSTAQDEAAVPGCRVRVRFAGQRVAGYLVERADTTEHTGRLAFLERVTSSEPVLSSELLALARAVAQRYGGTVIDVLRLAIPPRHARVEGEVVSVSGGSSAPNRSRDPSAWTGYQRGEALLTALREGRTARAVWQALPGDDWPRRLAEAAATVADRGRGAVLVVPDRRDLDRLHEACVDLTGEDGVVALSADLGPAERYRRWLRVSRGHARVVVGTRAAMFAPVTDVGLLVIWDDGDDLHSEPRAPYPHVRDVLIQRSRLSGASLVVAGLARTAEAQLLVDSGWAHAVVATRDQVRARMPKTTGVGDDFELARDPAARSARLPAVAFEAARQSLAGGAPVLVQVPRRGYIPGLACAACRAPARCRRCAGPLRLTSGREDPQPPQCRWCATPEVGFRCQACGSARLRAQVIGARRTAEELGMAFPGTPVRTSGGSEVLATVVDKPALVVTTPGAEPIAEGGYGAALLLDGWALLGRQDLRAGEETLRRWMAAAALVRSGQDGGRVVACADTTLVTVQALVRWDPAWHAERELADRSALGFPPAVRMASVQAATDVLPGVLDELALPAAAEVLGPVPVNAARPGDDELERALIRVPRPDGQALATALAELQARRSARKDPNAVRIQLDPLDLV